jgi:TonB family protein
MSSPPKALKTFNGLDRNGRRLCWLLDMHGIELDWPDGLPSFVQRLRTDRHLAMDFWALVRSFRRSETAGLSDQQITALVVSCVCGTSALPCGHDDKTALADLTGMLAGADASMDAEANLPDAIAMPEQREGRSIATEWSGVFEDAPERPRISEPQPLAADTLVAANPASNPDIQTHSMHEISQSLSQHLDEALSRLELTSLELKVHLDNLDSRMSRIEPHLEDITTLVASSLGASSLTAFKPAASSPEVSMPAASAPAATPAAFTPAAFAPAAFARSSSPEDRNEGVDSAVLMVPPEPEPSWRDRAAAPTPPASALPAFTPAAFTPSSSPEHHNEGVNSAVLMVSPEPELSWRDRASAWGSNSAIAGWPDKAKTAWANRPQWMNKPQWKNRPQWMHGTQWKKSLPTLPPHLLPDLKQSWLGARQFVTARWQRIPRLHIASVAYLLVAALAGGAILVRAHRHPPAGAGTLPSEVKSTQPASTTPAPDNSSNAIPDNLPLSPDPAETEKVNAENLDVKSGDSGAIAPGTPQTDKQAKKRENDLVAKPTFKWLGDDSDTSPQENDKTKDSVPKSAVLGEKSSAPAPSAIGIDTSGSLDPVTVSSDVMAANLLSSPSPSYPEVAKLTHQQGPVVVQAVISKDGRVDSVHVLKGHLVLRRAAANAVLNWRYKPYLLDGHPVDVATTITVNFSSDDSHKSSTDNSN